MLVILAVHLGTSVLTQGWVMLKEKMAKGGVTVLWAGWEGNYMANVIGNYPWFATMNVLQKHVAGCKRTSDWRCGSERVWGQEPEICCLHVVPIMPKCGGALFAPRHRLFIHSQVDAPSTAPSWTKLERTSRWNTMRASHWNTRGRWAVPMTLRFLSQRGTS